MLAKVAPAIATMPWMDRTLSADSRAELVLKQMTLEEKLSLVHGTGWGVLRKGAPVPALSNRGAGYVPGIPRLGIPDINLADSAVGIQDGRSGEPLRNAAAFDDGSRRDMG